MHDRRQYGQRNKHNARTTYSSTKTDRKKKRHSAPKLVRLKRKAAINDSNTHLITTREDYKHQQHTGLILSEFVLMTFQWIQTSVRTQQQYKPSHQYGVDCGHQQTSQTETDRVKQKSQNIRKEKKLKIFSTLERAPQESQALREIICNYATVWRGIFFSSMVSQQQHFTKSKCTTPDLQPSSESTKERKSLQTIQNQEPQGMKRLLQLMWRKKSTKEPTNVVSLFIQLHL